MRARPRLLQTLTRTARRATMPAVVGLMLGSGLGSGLDLAPATMADTVTSRMADAATGLVESTPRSTPPLVLARARGHLAALTDEVDAADLRMQPDARGRLAWLEAAMTTTGLGPGASRDDARAATRRALDLLAEVAPNDDAVVLDRTVAAILAGEGSIDDLPVAALPRRPFAASPDAWCDRLVAGGASIQTAMLDRADPAALPAVVAAILAGDPAPDPSVVDRLAALDHGPTGLGSQIVFELARRDAGDALAGYVRDHPDAVTLPGVRVAAIAAIAPTNPDAAAEILGDPSVIDRLPGRGRAAVRSGFARGLADRDPDAALDHALEAGQLDDRIEAMLAIRPAVDADPDRTLEDVKSCRTLSAGRLTAALATRRLQRARTTEAIADLVRTGRFDLAYSLLAPNTTEPSRPADGWLPTRLELLSDALARADAAPDAWIPLLESVPRIAGVDGQVEALAAIARGLAAVLPPDADLPEPLRAVLSDILVEIALRG